MVETELIVMDYAKTAKAYILYRNDRAAIRAKKQEVPARVKAFFDESKKYFKNQLSEFVYLRSYSRLIEEEGRREIIETVGRYIHFMKDTVGTS